MKNWGLMRVAAAFVAFTLITILYISTDEPFSRLHPYITMQIADEPDWNTYLVYGQNCRIRKINPFDDGILEYLAPTSPVTCSPIEPLSTVEQRNGSNILIIDKSLLHKYKSYSSHRIECCYNVISRISQSLHNYTSKADLQYKISNCEKVDKQAVLKNSTQFIFVKCQSIAKKQKKGKEVYKSGHALIPVLPELEEKVKQNKRLPDESFKNITQERLNVLIIGIDSVSRSSLRRTMSSTLQYFERHEWFELDGYNKIADNTFPNLMAILTGKTVGQIRKECKPDKASMDDCPNIWKDFRNAGYVTAYAEDVPVLSTFNYKMTGFVEQPTDYYMRPFMLAAHSKLSVKYKDSLPICIGAESAADHIFNYAKYFANTFKDNPYFGLFWLNSFTHNNVNSPAALDLRLLRLLLSLQNIGTYKNTIVIVLSDHGIRFGKIRKTFLGYLEERLPFIFIHIPKNILEKYPDVYRNMLANRRKLTSPYDLHETLLQVLGKEGATVKACPKCRSLFEQVPNDRRCDDAGIDPDWCTCPDYRKVQKTDPLAKQVGEFLYQRILNRTRDLMIADNVKPDLCLHREYDDIIWIYESKAFGPTVARSPTQIFVVVIATKPFATFEATIRANETVEGYKFEVLGFISRLDSYLNTTKCVQSKMLQFYCHCFDAII